jgi:hypothetical protein
MDGPARPAGARRWRRVLAVALGLTMLEFLGIPRGQAQVPPLVPPQIQVATPIQPPAGNEPYFDLDAYMAQTRASDPAAPEMEEWHWLLLPSGLVYRPYLAGVKEPRMGVQLYRDPSLGWLWEATLGSQVGLFRYGTSSALNPEGFELDVEGAAMVRLQLEGQRDLQSVDFRGGIPLTYGWGRNRTKLAYYHMSSHVGDEYLVAHPTYRRLNWSRDAFVLGDRFYVTPDWSLYGEVGWAFYSDISQEWEFQFGVEWAPPCPTGIAGAPFLAANAHLREEVDYGGDITLEAGWAWRSAYNGHLFRLGAYYYNGKSSQFEFYNEHEQQVGAGMWYDF